MTRREEIIWAAGLFEGEGCITYGGLKTCLNIRVGMTDRDVVERFHRIVGSGRMSGFQREAPKKYCYVWHVSGEKAARFLEEMLPFLGERRTAKALEALAGRAAHIENQTKPKLCKHCLAMFTPRFRPGYPEIFCSRECMTAWHDGPRRRIARARKRLELTSA